MAHALALLLIRGRKVWADIVPRYQDAVKDELAKFVATKKITQAEYDKILGIKKSTKKTEKVEVAEPTEATE